MSQQQVHPRSFVNGTGRRGRNNDSARSDVQSWRVPPRPSSALTSSSPSPSPTSADEDARPERPMHDRLLFVTMCLIGQYVDVQVKNGSVYSGIFHTANAEKDYGVVLKMARLTKDGSGKMDSVREAARKPPLRTLIIHAKDFVQIFAKDVPLAGEALVNGRAKENKQDLITDSLISQNRRDTERELKPWKPDVDAPKDLALDSTFQNPSNRSWDQFETNKKMFGVESTYNEELYTTKLEKGLQTREREKEATRLAKEIECESTRNIHLAEERGVVHDEVDEETKYSSVLHDDVGDDGEEGQFADDCNDETFGRSSAWSTESNASSPASLDQQDPAVDEMVSSRDARLQGKSKDAEGLVSAGVSSAEVTTAKYSDVHSSRPTSSSGKSDDSGKANEEQAIATVALSPPAIAAPPASALPIPIGLSSSASSSTLASHTRAPEFVQASDASSSSVPRRPFANPTPKFKFNPNAKVFTPSSQRPPSPSLSPQPSPQPLYLQPMMPVGVFPAQTMTQYSSSLTVTAPPYIQQPPATGYVPAAPVAPPQVPRQPQQAQPQMLDPYQQQQAATLRYMPQPPPAYPPPPYQQVMYGQHPPAASVLYIAQQPLMPPQPAVPMQAQPPLPPPMPQQQQQQQTHSSGSSSDGGSRQQQQQQQHMRNLDIS